jgi:signal transduction histidine kinase
VALALYIVAVQNSFQALGATVPLALSISSNQPELSAHAPRVITKLADALSLPLDKAKDGLPVSVLATVTYCHPQWRMLFVQDGAAGTYLAISPDSAPMRPGDVVRIKGTTSTSHGYPEIRVDDLTLTGRRQALTQRTWALEDILNGHASGQWLQIEGHIVSAFGRDGRLMITVVVGATNITAYLMNWKPELAAQLLDTWVRITGVLSVQFDQDGQRSGVALLAQDPSQIQVLQAPSTSPLALPVIPIDRLTVFKEGRAGQRVHVQGALEQGPDGSALAVRDRTSVVDIQCSYKPEVRPGSAVDVFGYPKLTDGELVLKDAIILPTESMPATGNAVAQGSSTNQAPLPLLESVQAVRRLTKAEAGLGYPVQLEAVVTFSDPYLRFLYVQDSSGGLFVSPAGRRTRAQSGQHVLVRGITAAGVAAPTVRRATFDVLGDVALPAPVRVGMDALLTGQFDCRWVELQGVVQSAMEKDRRCWLQVMTAQGEATALLGPALNMSDGEKLVDARVTLRGVAGGQFNQQGQIVAVRLNVPDSSAISMDEAPPANPFSIPAQKIGGLSSYQPDQDIFRRIKICGRVTSVAQDHTISVQDGSGGMLIRLTRWDVLPQIGEQVEVLGYPMAGDFSITLKDAWSKVTSAGGTPPPLVMTAEAALTNEPNAELVQIEARLIQNTWLRPAQVLLLQAGSVVFEAVLPAKFTPAAEEQLEADTVLQVTGVCLLEGGRWGQVKSFRLRVREPQDLKVLSRPPWLNLRKLLLILAGTGVVGSLGLVWSLLLAKKNRLLSEQIHERKRAELELQRAHDHLEQRVAERTLELREQIAAKDKAHAELAAAQKDLMEASREAGMAEIATGVLHNVGNVLNSVNVSNNIIQQKLRRSEFLTLGKVRGLLQEHENDLASFLTTDPKGQLVPGFIIKLANNIDKELSLLQSEHEHLTRNVEHIKEIVAMQQTYARVSGSREKVRMASLVDDALEINNIGFGRNRIEVVRDYSEVPEVTVDKHRVLQILVNLITNAKHALDEAGRPDPRLTLKIAMNGNNCLKVAVSDNGIGIAPENFPRVFSYGFTTRKTGHGFGLHSGVNAAREMGGQLTVHSDGAGKGATFVLEIPLENHAAN